MKVCLRQFFILLLLLFCIDRASLYSRSRFIFIAPNGNDDFKGTGDKPLSSLAGARDLIRQEFKNGRSDTVIVTIRDGFYLMTGPLILEPEDSGTERYPIIYKAEKGASPVFSGGRAISGFVEAENGLWKTVIPEVVGENWYFEQLYVNDRRATRARSPNDGYYTFKEVRETVLVRGTGRAPEKARQTIQVSADNIKPLSLLTSQEFDDVLMTVYHKWDITMRFLDSIDVDSGYLMTSGRVRNRGMSGVKISGIFWKISSLPWMNRENGFLKGTVHYGINLCREKR